MDRIIPKQSEPFLPSSTSFTLDSLTSICTRSTQHDDASTLKTPSTLSTSRPRNDDNTSLGLSQPTITYKSDNYLLKKQQAPQLGDDTSLSDTVLTDITHSEITKVELDKASITSFDIAYDVLRSQPSLDRLTETLTYIASQDVHHPSPSFSRIVNVLVTEIIPHHWPILTDISTGSTSHKKGKRLLLECLRNTTGLGGIVAALRRSNAKIVRHPGNVVRYGDGDEGGSEGTVQVLLDVLSRLLRGDSMAYDTWTRIMHVAMENNTSKTSANTALVWKEFVTLVAGGRILSIAAEASMSLSSVSEDDDDKEHMLDKKRDVWISNGKKYTDWLGKNIAFMMASLDVHDKEDGGWKALSIMVGRALNLGYTDALIDVKLYKNLLHTTEDYSMKARKMLSVLNSQDARAYINALLKLLSSTHFPPSYNLEVQNTASKSISIVSTILYTLCHDYDTDGNAREIILEWIIKPESAGSDSPVGVRRAIFACINTMSDGIIILQDLLDKAVATFGDPLWIRHAPIVYQEANAQCLLLAAGYVHRQPPSYLKVMVRTSVYLNAINNRIASTNPRARFLGMAVGEAISKLVDKEGSRMSFSDVHEIGGDEGEQWKSLVDVDDIVGDLIDLKSYQPRQMETKTKKKIDKEVETTSTILSVEEVDDEETPNNIHIRPGRIDEVNDDSDSDLEPMSKPDSDPEDSDEDPTLVSRDKPTPPVYIRDLLYMLHATDSYDKQTLALQHAPDLIRRKANFGTEVSAHLTELLDILTGMQDNFDMDHFDSMKLKALIALVVTFPKQVGQWMSRCVFEGEWSLSQRCVVLSAIGMGAMELSGQVLKESASLTTFTIEKTSNQENTNGTKQLVAPFPTKRLPKHLHNTYTVKSTPITALTSSLQSTLLQPMAVQAADKLTGPDVLKIRKFSSRMEADKRANNSITNNKLGNVVNDAFFGPLLNAWWVHSTNASSMYSSSVSMHPHLLGLYVQTLSIILHAVGPNALVLPTLTSTFWTLLLALRHHHLAITSSNVIDAILFGMLTILEVNAGSAGGRDADRNMKRVAEENGAELMETQRWVQDVFEGKVMVVEGGDEAGRKGVCAGILIRCREVMERYERLLMGRMLEG